MARTPTDPTKAQVWITKGLDDLDFEFYFPQGPKGDPGGVVDGTILGDYSLNTVVTSGVYRQSSSAAVFGTLVNNYPYQGAYGVLVVFKIGGNDIIQTFYGATYSGTADARVTYQRNYSNGVWTTWRIRTSHRTDTTAGRAIYMWDQANIQEQLVYGDTGDREVKTLTTYPIAASWGTIRLRRIGNTVTMVIQGMDSSFITGDPAVLTLPSGFVPTADVRTHFVTEGGFNLVRYLVGVNGNVIIANRQNNAGGTYLYTSGTVSWVTNQAWPTSLPGTAVGIIPSL